MKGSRALALSEGEGLPSDLDAGEQALAALVHKTAMAPTTLCAEDLQGVRHLYGLRGALEIAAYIASFHFINRIADLVGIQSDIPIVQPRFAALRRVGVRMQGWMMGKMVDLSRHSVDDEVDVPALLAEIEGRTGALPSGYAALTEAPNVAAYLAGASAVAAQLPREVYERAAAAVDAALPRGEDEAVGFHPRPTDPLEALAFVGTRYASRTTQSLVDAVRDKYGYDDAALTDLFFAIAYRNGMARFDRLLDGFA